MPKPIPFPSRYQFRRNPTQRPLDVASEDRACEALLEQSSTRMAIRPLAMRRYVATAAACGLI